MLSPTKYLARAGKGFNVIACAALISMMLLSTADVVMRFFNRPIPGTYELIGFLGAVTVSFALAFTSLEKGHIAVDLLASRLPQRAQLALDAFVNLCGALITGMIAYQAVIYGMEMRQSGEVSLTIQMPLYPVIFGIALGCALLCMLLCVDSIKALQRTLAR